MLYKKPLLIIVGLIILSCIYVMSFGFNNGQYDEAELHSTYYRMTAPRQMTSIDVIRQFNHFDSDVGQEETMIVTPGMPDPNMSATEKICWYADAVHRYLGYDLGIGYHFGWDWKVYYSEPFIDFNKNEINPRLDCSGFVSQVLYEAGLYKQDNLERVLFVGSSQSDEWGKLPGFSQVPRPSGGWKQSDLQAGDLVATRDPRTNGKHIQIYVGDGMIIHRGSNSNSIDMYYTTSVPPDTDASPVHQHPSEAREAIENRKLFNNYANITFVWRYTGQ